MNEIPELKDDFAFLKKFDSRNKVWKEFDKGNEKVRSNFLLHPKRFSSDSECSTNPNTPRKFFSGTFLKSLHEPNNNVRKPVLIEKRQINENVDKGNGRGDSVEVSLSIPKSAVKKASRFRPSSYRFDNFDRKFKSMAERCLKILTNIKVTIEGGIPPADGEDDYFRRMKRLQEFSSRFSRIYLYPLSCQMDELSTPEKLTTGMINQKFIYAQQVILQGLQAYYHHLPTSTDKCASEKLNSLLDQTMHMCHVFELLKKDSNPESWEFVKAMRSHVELLLETLTTFDLKFEKKRELKKKPKSNKPKAIKSKLAMYNTSVAFRKDLEYRRAVESLKNRNVKSRYKTAGFKHRPPVEKKTCADSTKIRLLQKASSGFSKPTPRNDPVREDDIKTMVEMDADLEAPPNTTENANRENISIGSSDQQLVQEQDGIDDGKVERALEILRKFFGSRPENKRADFLERIANEVDKRKEERGNDKFEKPKNKIKEPVVTVTGTKNAKLICIRDDNSLVEEEFKKDKEMMTDVEKITASSETQTEMRRTSKSTIKISRLPKSNRRVLQWLPKEYAINVIQYKLRYGHFHKHNPMYRKSAHVQPWILMGKISDDILDHVLESVTGELEVNEILENLYNAEFQY